MKSHRFSVAQKHTSPTPSMAKCPASRGSLTLPSADASSFAGNGLSSGWRRTSASANLGCMLSGSRPADTRKGIFHASQAVSERKCEGQKAWPTQSMGSAMVARRWAPLQSARTVQQNHQGAGRDLDVLNRHAGKQRNRSADVTSCAVWRLHKGCVLAFVPAEMEGVNPDDD